MPNTLKPSSIFFHKPEREKPVTERFFILTRSHRRRMLTTLQTLFMTSAAPSDEMCAQYATRKDCLYAPEPRCSWETTAGNSSCVCALDTCAPVDLCALWPKESCDESALPNGAPCTWNATGGYCTCVDPSCATRQPTCSVDEHCEDTCAFPCECAAGHCYLIDECWRYDGPDCDSSMWHGQACCKGQSSGPDAGCFLCQVPPLCETAPPAAPTLAASRSRALPLGMQQLAQTEHGYR